MVIAGGKFGLPTLGRAPGEVSINCARLEPRGFKGNLFVRHRLGGFFR